MLGSTIFGIKSLEQNPEDKPKLYVKLAYKNHVSRILVSPLRGNRVK